LILNYEYLNLLHIFKNIKTLYINQFLTYTYGKFDFPQLPNLQHFTLKAKHFAHLYEILQFPIEGYPSLETVTFFHVTFNKLAIPHSNHKEVLYKFKECHFEDSIDQRIKHIELDHCDISEYNNSGYIFFKHLESLKLLNCSIMRIIIPKDTIVKIENCPKLNIVKCSKLFDLCTILQKNLSRPVVLSINAKKEMINNWIIYINA